MTEFMKSVRVFGRKGIDRTTAKQPQHNSRTAVKQPQNNRRTTAEHPHVSRMNKSSTK